MKEPPKPLRCDTIVSDPSIFTNKRLGLLGGSFDPVHNGHLAIASAVKEAHALDAVLFIPAKKNPLKASPTCASTEQRIEMLTLALDSTPYYFLSTLEINRKGPSYSVDTAEEIARETSGSKLFWIAGLDNLVDRAGRNTSLAHWHQKDRFLDLVHFVVCTRNFPGVEENPAAAINELPEESFSENQRKALLKHAVQIPPIFASSTEIRALLANDSSSDLPVPEAVARYITYHRLYGLVRQTAE